MRQRSTGRPNDRLLRFLVGLLDLEAVFISLAVAVAIVVLFRAIRF